MQIKRTKAMKYLRRRGIALLAAMLLVPVQSNAAVNFLFRYTEDNKGFNDGSQRSADMKVALQEIGEKLGAILNHTATVEVEITSFSINNTDTLASAGQSLTVTGEPGVKRGHVEAKIIDRVDDFPNSSEAGMQWNFAKTFHTGKGLPGPGENDFRSVALHELTHALGFSSLIEADGQGITHRVFNPVTEEFDDSGDEIYSTYDSFLEDRHGNGLVDVNGDFVAAITDLVGVVKFDGLEARTSAGGRRITTHTPDSFNPSSLSHLDGDLYPDDLLGPAITIGTTRRNLSSRNVGILRDIGYDIIPEPAVALTLMAMAVGMTARRRTGAATAVR